MAKTTKSRKAAPPTPLSREDLLEAMWMAQARAILAAIESGEATAATLGVCRAFLADNGVNLDALRNLRMRSGFARSDVDMTKMPTFSDDEDEGSNDPALEAKPDPLRVVPDFAPPREDDDTE